MVNWNIFCRAFSTTLKFSQKIVVANPNEKRIKEMGNPIEIEVIKGIIFEALLIAFVFT